ncbi:unnamed protein product [Durusdinium trenchii]|uniref:Uncharacterized protein n=2 Tax=Durusdinium trenchii TaxID=1381693 RepID=A0ABP0PGQ5_9DINO
MATKQLLSLEDEMALLPGKGRCGELSPTCERPRVRAFWELCCSVCVDSACSLSQTLIQMAQEVWHELLGGPCESAFLAAAVVLLQSSTLAFGDGGLPFLKSYLKSELTWSDTFGAGQLPQLHPFPFAAEFLVLYQNFVPLSMVPSCEQTDSVELFRVACSSADGYTKGLWQPNCSQDLHWDRAILLPQAELKKASCFTEADDQTLALRCRSRRFDSLLLAQKEQARKAFEWRCPSQSSGSRNKYSEQSFRNCAAGFGSWGRRIESHLKCVAVQVAETLQLRPEESVLDWGSGCGWALTWMSALYGIRGYGIEATSQNIAWARRFSSGQYCLYGGLDLGWVSDESFDAVISYWVLYHHNATSQCHVVRQLVRKLRPGGRAWFGGNIPSQAINILSEPFRRRDWMRCLLPARVGGVPVSLDFLPDATLFRNSLNHLGQEAGDYLHFHPTYSVVIRRM